MDDNIDSEETERVCERERETDTDLLTTLKDYKRLSFPTLGRAVRKRKTMNSIVRCYNKHRCPGRM